MTVVLERAIQGALLSVQVGNMKKGREWPSLESMMLETFI